MRSILKVLLLSFVLCSNTAAAGDLPDCDSSFNAESSPETTDLSSQNLPAEQSPYKYVNPDEVFHFLATDAVSRSNELGLSSKEVKLLKKYLKNYKPLNPEPRTFLGHLVKASFRLSRASVQIVTPFFLFPVFKAFKISTFKKAQRLIVTLIEKGYFDQGTIPWIKPDSSLAADSELIQNLTSYSNIKAKFDATLSLGKFFFVSGLSLILIVEDLHPLQNFAVQTPDVGIPSDSIPALKLSRVAEEEFSQFDGAKNAVLILDQQFTHKFPPGKSIVARHISGVDFVQMTDWFEDLLNRVNEVRLVPVNNALELKQAFENIEPSTNIVILMAHGRAGEIYFGSESPADAIKAILDTKTTPTKQRTLIFISCQFAGETTSPISEQAWIKIANHLLKESAEGQAFGSNAVLEVGYRLTPELALWDVLFTSSRDFLKNGSGITHINMISSFLTPDVEGAPTDSIDEDTIPKVLIYDPRTGSVEKIEQ